MTAQKFYGILAFLEALDKKLNLQSSLESVRNALSTLVSAPAQPQHQNTLASALAQLEKAAAQLDQITPSQYALIQVMGGEDFFDPSIAEKVKTSVQTNAMTPSVAKDFVDKLATRRAEFLSTVSTARQEMQKLKVTASALAPGAADVSFIIPRDIFDNELGQFAKELTFVSRLLQHYSEALTGQAEDAALEQLSSSIPTVALAASVPVIGAIAVVVNKFLEAWERIEKIRKIRAELTEIGMKGAAVNELTEQITTTVDEVVEQATELVIVKYPGSPERKNELTNAVRQDTRRLFGQIERGLIVEFRAEPREDSEGEERKAMTDISELARSMQFPEIPREPMLLGNAEIIEGDIKIGRQFKKTTTRKTTQRERALADRTQGL